MDILVPCYLVLLYTKLHQTPFVGFCPFFIDVYLVSNNYAFLGFVHNFNDSSSLD